LAGAATGAPTGGRATTTVVCSGRDAMAGGEGGGATTALEGWRGCGITVFFAGTTVASGAGAADLAAGCTGSTTAAVFFAGAGAPDSAALRARMAFSASPGLETPERSNFGSAAAFAPDFAEGRPLVRYSRTFAASSNSMELEWVFVAVTPTAVSASRMDLLFTSSSRARSLIRTLLIRPFLSSVLCG